MLCAEIWIPRRGNIRVSPQIKLTTTFCIQIGGTPQRRVPGIYIPLSTRAQHVHTTREFMTTTLPDGSEKIVSESRYLSGGQVIPHPDGTRLLIVEHSTASLVPDQILVVVHLESGSGVGNQSSAFFTTQSTAHILIQGYKYRRPDPARYATLGTIGDVLAIMRPGEHLNWKRSGTGLAQTEGNMYYYGRTLGDTNFFGHIPPGATETG